MTFDPSFLSTHSTDRPKVAFGVAPLGWEAFDVARFHLVEEISTPYRADVALVRPARLGPVDLGALLGASATLAIASATHWKLVHGIVVEAERVGRTADQLRYRVVLAPAIHRARLRRRCRTFVDRTLHEVLTSVLTNEDPSSGAADGGLSLLDGPGLPALPAPVPALPILHRWHYRFAVSDASRLHHASLRSYVVQYNESDLSFLERLLEEEGLSYFFENVADGVVMTITDRPGSIPLFASDAVARTRASSIGGDFDAELVEHIAERASLGASVVAMGDDSWARPGDRLEGRAEAEGAATGSADQHYEFPARDEAIAEAPAAAPARFVLEGLRAADHLAEGRSTIRSLTPGFRLLVQDFGVADHDVLVVRVEASGSQLEDGLDGHGSSAGRERRTYANRFWVLPMTVPFRPLRRAARPRIDGVQTATVTAEEHGASPPEVNADAHARVRVRFPWDQRAVGPGPSSMWIRVSQSWAGPSFGALAMPRVGHEVLVSYLQGDPERPVIVGRVYNARCPPPYDPAGKPGISTIKSRSTPCSEGYNELRFDDTAGAEEVFLRAERDLTEHVLVDRRTEVGGARSEQVRGDDTLTVTNGSRSISVERGDLTVHCPNGTLKLDTGPGSIVMRRDAIVIDSGAGAKITVRGSSIKIEAADIVAVTPDGTMLELVGPRAELNADDVFWSANQQLELTSQLVTVISEGACDVHGNPIQLNCR